MPRGSAGYSLLELLVVLAIIALIVAVAVPPLIGGSDRIVLAADARAVATQLRTWRDEALDNQKEVTIRPGLAAKARHRRLQRERHRAPGEREDRSKLR